MQTHIISINNKSFIYTLFNRDKKTGSPRDSSLIEFFADLLYPRSYPQPSVFRPPFKLFANVPRGRIYDERWVQIAGFDYLILLALLVIRRVRRGEFRRRWLQIVNRRRVFPLSDLLLALLLVRLVDLLDDFWYRQYADRHLDLRQRSGR